MKTLPSISPLLTLIISMTWGAGAQAEDNTPANLNPSQAQSIFVQPAGPRDGRDPFFPESTRIVETSVPTTHTVEISSLKVPGIFGESGHLLAIINNHTFAAGDEGDVKTSAGTVHLRCLQIQTDHVIVEMNGQIHRINLDAE
jgi:hypothetical protein